MLSTIISHLVAFLVGGCAGAYVWNKFKAKQAAALATVVGKV